MKYEIVTHDGKIYEINQDDPKIIAKLASKLELIPVTLANGKIEYFAKGNVARIQRTDKPIFAFTLVGTSNIHHTSCERLSILIFNNENLQFYFDKQRWVIRS